MHEPGTDKPDQHRACHTADRSQHQRRQYGNHLLRRCGRKVGKDQDRDEKRNQAAGLRFGQNAFFQKSQCKEYRPHDQAHDEIVDHASGQLGSIVCSHGNQAEFCQIYRRPRKRLRQLQRPAFVFAAIFLRLLAVFRHERFVLTELPRSAPQQDGGDRHADKLLRHIQHDAERAGRGQPHLVQRSGHDQRRRAAAGKNRGACNGHVPSNDRNTDHDNRRNRAANAAYRGDNDLPLTPQLSEINGRTQRDDQQPGNHVSEPRDLRVLDQGPGKDTAPKADQQQDRNAQHSGKYRFGLLSNQFSDSINTQQDRKRENRCHIPHPFWEKHTMQKIYLSKLK